MIWNEHAECMPREDLEALQLRRLQELVVRVYHNVPFYRKKLQAVGYEPGDIASLKDIEELPFTTKQDLRDNYPFDMFAVPMSRWSGSPPLPAPTASPPLSAIPAATWTSGLK